MVAISRFIFDFPSQGVLEPKATICSTIEGNLLLYCLRFLYFFKKVLGKQAYIYIKYFVGEMFHISFSYAYAYICYNK